MRSILVVDDDKIMRDMLAAQLQQAGFSANAVGSSQAALSVLATERFAAIITDFQMPGQDGIEFLEVVKDQGWDVPVILMTAFASSGTERRALESGACAFLAKPFTASELLTAVAQAISA